MNLLQKVILQLVFLFVLLIFLYVAHQASTRAKSLSYSLFLCSPPWSSLTSHFQFQSMSKGLANDGPEALVSFKFVFDLVPIPISCMVLHVFGIFSIGAIAFSPMSYSM